MFAIGTYTRQRTISGAATLALAGYVAGHDGKAAQFAKLAEAEGVARDMNAAGHWPGKAFAPCTYPAD